MTTTPLETGLSLHCERLGHVYSSPTGETVALQDVTLTVRPGETMAVLMATGHAVNIPDSIFDPVRTLTATIAAAMNPKKHFATSSLRRFLRMKGVSVNMRVISS